MDNDKNKESYTNYFDKNVPESISIIIFVIGMFGNLFSLAIFNQSKMKKNSTYIYLRLLSVVDLFVLVLGLGDMIVISHWNYVLRNQSYFVCRVHTFFTYCCTHLSSLILASLSIDRAIATNAINFAKVYCRPNMAYQVFCLNCVLVGVINFHYLVFLGYDEPRINFNVKVNNETSVS